MHHSAAYYEHRVHKCKPCSSFQMFVKATLNHTIANKHKTLIILMADALNETTKIRYFFLIFILILLFLASNVNENLKWKKNE